MKSKKPVVVSLFSGGGGLDVGLAAAGYEILFESDIDEVSCRTLSHNGEIANQHGLEGFENALVRNEDVCNLSGTDILTSIGLNRFDVDLLAGGPPCQAFSVFGKRKGTDDHRGQMSFEYKRLVSEIAPKAFLFENVAGLLTVESGQTYKRLIEELSSPSEDVTYRLFCNRVNAEDYCVPQSRDRVIIIGVRDDVANELGIKEFELSPCASNDPTTQLYSWRTVEDAFRDLPALKSKKSLANHHGRNHSQRIIERYAALGPGERDGKTRINRLDLGRPSYTIVVGSDAGGGKGHVHPSEPREVTPRESARIQTFPDWWSFTGSVRDEIRQVGNAVPSLLGFAVGNSLRSQVFSLSEIPFKDGISRLAQQHLFKNK